MIRGEIWTYQGLARIRTVLVVSADELNAAGLPMTLEITDVRPTGARAMLAVPAPGHGHILIRPVDKADPERFLNPVDHATDDTMDAVGMALRSALDL
ncbi:type II toxin-antitoxin system PemK/MazF family toxin [Nocardia wallacei]|uniref:type II toxin-antitoxin system PemK/MazF family toxin n=1 Tax=Nocardia wallacei TaxID=480035 RepID=UPI002456EC9B|nr:type II toxin-antitoxin system PemK/MazF family toxin [Nocardia wallacei]